MDNLEKWIDKVKEIYDRRMSDPYFKNLIDEYRKVLKDVRGQEPDCNTEILKKFLPRDEKTRHIIDLGLEYILESDMMFGPLTPIEISAIVDCLAYIAWNISEEKDVL